MTTPQSIKEILAWQAAHAGQINYSEVASTRLAYDTAHLTTATDCSGMAARMFRHFAGINPGTYTGNECNYGRLITTNRSQAAAGEGMLPGDVILFDWDGGTWDHIAIYAGSGRIWNHGGPGKGPLNWSLSANVWAAVKVMVRRWVEPVAPRPNPHPAPDNTKKLHRMWPSRYMGPNDYFGLISGPDHSRGGANAAERPDIEAIKRRLHALGYGGMNLESGVFGSGTKAAVTAWQRKHYAKTTTNYGEVWHDDWNHLFTY
jgi:peptidoglycan hydrolase-like protein with peptidoglycan-binding domain